MKAADVLDTIGHENTQEANVFWVCGKLYQLQYKDQEARVPALMETTPDRAKGSGLFQPTSGVG
ncbi:MAG: hypothetical protein ABSH56_13070 [Bryobacteraceae bacterium]|jgi:hypothetical protein